jgi:hypothetical protein
MGQKTRTEMMMESAKSEQINRGPVVDYREEWLDEFPWQWECTFIFRTKLTKAQVRQRLLRWLRKLCRELGTPGMERMISLDVRTPGISYHIHVLIGGLKKSGLTQRNSWMKRSVELGGLVYIDKYVRRPDGVHSMFKTIADVELDDGKCPYADCAWTRHENRV